MIVVTGATGFVGRALVAAAVRQGRSVRAVVRTLPRMPVDGAEYVVGGGLSVASDWRAALRGADAVIHAAARVHVMRDTAQDPLAEFRRTNVDGTIALARQAAESGVRRFVFVSSIKVNGERSEVGRPMRSSDPAGPTDPYGLSKFEAEEALRAIARNTALEVAVIRPVLVYGPGVGANFAALLRLIARRLPLPLGAIHNKRSFVALTNLVDLLLVCVDHPAAAGGTFLVSDGEDLSTTDLLRRLAHALQVKNVLVPVPEALLRLCARLLRRDDLGLRLFGSLQVDIEHTRATLAWNPPVSVDDALRETALEFRRRELGR